MKTPHKLSPRQLSDAIFHWMNTNALDTGRWYVCVHCGEAICSVDVAFSLHAAEMGDHCAGAGRVKRIPIPFCAKCEPRPEEYGCVHIAIADARDAVRINAEIGGGAA